MSDTKQKPDGWVATNKDGYFYWEWLSLCSEEGVFAHIVRSLNLVKDYESIAEYKIAVDEAKRQGWKARPFVFLDEGEK